MNTLQKTKLRGTGINCGLIVLLLKLFYLAICLEQNSHNRKKVQR